MRPHNEFMRRGSPDAYVDPNCVRGWVEKFGSEAGAAPAGEGAMAAELRRLRKENARLLMERDILKKAAAFFAKEQP
jgi:transposase